MIKQMHKIEESVAFIWQYLGQGSIIYIILAGWHELHFACMLLPSVNQLL